MDTFAKFMFSCFFPITPAKKITWNTQKQTVVMKGPQNHNFCGTDMSTCQKCLMQLLNPLKFKLTNATIV